MMGFFADWALVPAEVLGGRDTPHRVFTSMVSCMAGWMHLIRPTCCSSTSSATTWRICWATWAFLGFYVVAGLAAAGGQILAGADLHHSDGRRLGRDRGRDGRLPAVLSARADRHPGADRGPDPHLHDPGLAGCWACGSGLQLVSGLSMDVAGRWRGLLGACGRLHRRGVALGAAAVAAARPARPTGPSGNGKPAHEEVE